jgi:hypothetical protein
MPRDEPYQSGDDAQERGFAGPIASTHQQSLAGRQVETQPAKHLATAAVAGQFLGPEFHHSRSLPFRPVGTLGQTPENPNILCILGDNRGEYGVGREKTL